MEILETFNFPVLVSKSKVIPHYHGIDATCIFCQSRDEIMSPGNKRGKVHKEAKIWNTAASGQGSQLREKVILIPVGHFSSLRSHIFPTKSWCQLKGDTGWGSILSPQCVYGWCGELLIRQVPEMKLVNSWKIRKQDFTTETSLQPFCHDLTNEKQCNKGQIETNCDTYRGAHTVVRKSRRQLE